MIINKVTVGFVTQQYDTELKRFVEQEFIAGDEVSWENQRGEPATVFQVPHNEDGTEPYLNFEMIQPATHTWNVGDVVVATPDIDDDWHEFVETAVGFRDNGNLITVRDQEENGWDCRPGQLTLDIE